MKNLLTVAALAAISSQTFGALVINYENSINGSGINISSPSVVTGDFDGDGDDPDNIFTSAFDQKLTTGASGYNGPSLLFGAKGTALDASDSNFDTRSVSSTISFRNQVNAPGQGATQLAGVFLADTPFSFDAASSVTVDQNRNELVQDQRFLARDAGGNVFVSDGSLGSASGTDMLSLTWASYDPTAEIDADLGALSYSTSTAGLGLLSGLGFYVERDTPVSGRFWFQMRDFVVDANPIPEPSMVILLGTAGALGLLLLRRRR